MSSATDLHSSRSARSAAPVMVPRAVVAWLITCAAMVLAMAIIGAITRLTGSGLSMVEWRPLIGIIPPLSEAEWMRVFELYRESPEYRHVNAGMSLDDFKLIFFWEWFHRVWGRLIGVVFAVPLIWFWVRRMIPAHLLFPLGALFVLGAFQGLLGWFMVMSGLVDRPSVSHYRLAAHLGLALIIYAYLVWIIVHVTVPRSILPPNNPVVTTIRRWTTAGLVLAAITICWGAFVAGLKAGLIYNTFPLMDGDLVPPGALSMSPVWINAFENTALVQFIHRVLGIATGLVVLIAWWRSWTPVLTERTRLVALGAGVAVVTQIALGIVTLLLQVPVWLGALHQAGAIVVLTMLVWLLYETREPSPMIAATRANG